MRAPRSGASETWPPSRREYVVGEYVQAREVYERAAAEAQTASWKCFCSAHDGESLWDSIYRVIRETGKKPGGCLTSNRLGTSNIRSRRPLAETFFPMTGSILTIRITRSQKANRRGWSSTRNRRICQGDHFTGLRPARCVGQSSGKDAGRAPPMHLMPRLQATQYGFMPQRGTEDVLYYLMTYIYKELNLKNIILMVSLDIEGAFDNAWWSALKAQLLAYNCPVNLYGMVKGYLQDREVIVRYAGGESRRRTSKDCIQGSIAGSTFWNLILDSLLRELGELGVYVQAFADDVVLMFSGQSASSIEEETNHALARVHCGGVRNKLRFAPSKTNSMVLTKKLKYDDPVVHMNGEQISLVGEIRLGLTIDRKLTFISHVAKACKKAINIYKGLARAAKATWGVPGSPHSVPAFRADPLEAAPSRHTSEEYDRFPLSYAKKVIRAASLKEWQQRYAEESTDEITKCFFTRVEQAYRILRDIDMTSQVAQTLTGHGGFAQYLFRLRDSPYYACDPVKIQNVLHVLEDCDMFLRERAALEAEFGVQTSGRHFLEILGDAHRRASICSQAGLNVRPGTSSAGGAPPVPLCTAASRFNSHASDGDDLAVEKKQKIKDDHSTACSEISNTCAQSLSYETKSTESNQSTAKPRKTKAEYQKEYRERQKAKKNEKKQESTAKPRKTNAEYQKEYRERQKAKKNEKKQESTAKPRKTKAEYQKEYRERQKAKKNENKQESIAKRPKTNAEHQKAFRERQKMKKIKNKLESTAKPRKTKAEYQKEYRERQKAKKNEKKQESTAKLPKTNAEHQKAFRERQKMKKIKNKNVVSWDTCHVLVHEFMSIYYALAGWSGNRERRDERTKRKREKEKVRSRSKIPISSKPAVRNFFPTRKAQYKNIDVYVYIRGCSLFWNEVPYGGLGGDRDFTA
ncbi:Putative 115 kDa protein in type-1 retrotransposable element R1DM [Eumeta japonica]|uniref:115 kDa protein in type-1 retrotransposable element R1DM n=1 Tax=Eumeta variegata TaxID=151549 RepID=A0A4C1ZWW5_EUMVA|nr:Putative 115 kDa protein in type-1 retrotransposable element R1DM [Eumeta japonica]